MMKRGATFRAEMAFSAAEWAEVYPHDSITARLRQGARTYDLTVSISTANRTISLSADSAQWQIGTAEFDILITQGGVRTPIPFGRNVPVKIIEGVSG